MSTTKIEWAERTWNPITGCSPVSPACDHCYAERMARRLAGRYGYPADEPFRVTLHEDRLDEPLRWRKPSRVFVCSMGDLFHEDVRPAFLSRVFDRMYRCPRQTFLLLTKRPERTKKIMTLCYDWYGGPLANVWAGVTAEDQQRADERIPILLDTPAAKRFVSCEPLLGTIDLTTLHRGWASYTHALRGWTTGGEARGEHARLDLVIVGCESGPGARPMQPEWAHDIYRQCKAAGVPFFFKKGTPGFEYDPETVATREWPG